MLFLLVLFIGGLWFSRSMTRAEIAVSAAIITALHLAVIILELSLPNFPIALSLTMTKAFQWTTTISSLLYQATHQLEFSAVAASFAPFLFVLFGKKAVKQAFAE